MNSEQRLQRMAARSKAAVRGKLGTVKSRYIEEILHWQRLSREMKQ